MWTNCERVLGRKPLQQQCGLIGYQPPAFNKEALRRQLVDKASRMLKERGDKWEKTCFSDAVHPSLLWAGGGSEADLRSDVFLSEKHSGGVGGAYRLGVALTDTVRRKNTNATCVLSM